MRILSRLVLPVLVLAATAGNVLAQGMPETQPGILTIFIEEVKVGMNTAHEANEAGWPMAFAKANSPYYYLALEAMTGPNEVWYVSPYESYAAEGESMKMYESNEALAEELSRLWSADAQYLNDARQIQAVARPDISHGAFPDLGRARFWDISMMRVRLGHEQAWENAARIYKEQVERAAPGMSYRIYQVTTGMPAGYYLIFSSVNDYAEYDQVMAQGNAMWEGVSPEDMATLEQFMAGDVQMMMTNRYRLNPTMSYVAEETKAVDPDFWK